MKTADLIGPTLDWAVAKIEGVRIETSAERGYLVNPRAPITFWFNVDDIWNPSTDWSQGGPIIEREDINISANKHLPVASKCHATIWGAMRSWQQDGPTPLIAAMRCYVASKLGDDVDVPKELL